MLQQLCRRIFKLVIAKLFRFLLSVRAFSLNHFMLPSSFLLEANWFSDSERATFVPSDLFERVHQLPMFGYHADAEGAASLKVAIHLHAHYAQEALYIVDSISNSCPEAHLYITYSDQSVRKAISAHCSTKGIFAKMHCLEFVSVPNQGRNVSPLLGLIAKILHKYPVALHLHTKKSPHFGEGNSWLKHMLASLVEDRKLLHIITSQFARDPKLGLVMPTAYKAIRPYLGWGGNLSLAKSFAMKLNPPILIDASLPLVFPAGMMFWFRPSLFLDLSCVYLESKYSEPEPLPADGALLHAIERLLVYICESRGFKWLFVFSSAGPLQPWQYFFRPLSVLEPCFLRYKFSNLIKCIGKVSRGLSVLTSRIRKK